MDKLIRFLLVHAELMKCKFLPENNLPLHRTYRLLGALKVACECFCFRFVISFF